MIKKNPSPSISVIIVNYNGKKWLKKCLDTVFRQTYKRYEVIVVDNGSNDGSAQLIQKNYPLARLIVSKRNLGFAGGNNKGIDAAKGPFIMLLNSDTWIDQDFLQKMMDRFYMLKSDVIGPTEIPYDKSRYHKYRTTIDFLGHPKYYRNDLDKAKLFYISGVCLLFRKQLYKETRGMDNRFFMYFEEIDWFWRLQLLRKKIAIADDIYVYHAGSGSTQKGLNTQRFLWRNQNTLQMILKNYSTANLMWILPIYTASNVIEMTAFLLILKPNISKTYIQGWIFCIKNAKHILKARSEVQRIRKASDSEIMKNMYLGFAKIDHLLHNLRRRNEKRVSTKSI